MSDRGVVAGRVSFGGVPNAGVAVKWDGSGQVTMHPWGAQGEYEVVPVDMADAIAASGRGPVTAPSSRDSTRARNALFAELRAVAPVRDSRSLLRADDDDDSDDGVQVSIALDTPALTARGTSLCLCVASVDCCALG
jgi:hypothetical protein